MSRKQKKTLARIIASAGLLLGMALGAFRPAVEFVLFALSYIIIGYDTLIRAFQGVKNRQGFDECFLMAVATIGAAALGNFTESVAVMLFYQIGELFESVAVGKSRKNISALMDIRPDSADLLTDSGEIVTVDPDEVEIGSVIVVKPGAKIPIDGCVIEGSSALDTTALTGESVPRTVRVGDEVLSGCVDLNGVLKIRTTKEFGESTASKILELVEDASSRKSKSEDFIAKFARYYTPAVCFGALVLALVPPLISLLVTGAANWESWVYRALTFLVISCPCALVISIPLTFFAGIGGAGGSGILIKGSNYMETLSKVKIVAFDKTGTVTKGVFEVSEIHPVGMDEETLLDYAAHAESFSSHPIAQSLTRALGHTPDKSRVSEVKEISGHGVTAKVDGVPVAVGNRRLMETLGIKCEDRSEAGTIVHLAVNRKYGGSILVSDTIKPEAAEAIDTLRRSGIKKTVMLTGDSEKVAQDAAAKLGIDEIHAHLLPADKVVIVEKLLGETDKNETLAFVGDGMNDAPVLSRADVGIAMGALGSDAAIEAADVVLMDDDPRKIGKAIGISQKCLRIVYENIIFAIGVKLVCLVLGAFGIANMWVAIFADVGVMVLAVLNAIRALNTKKL